jgi:hypothetical protein
MALIFCIITYCVAGPLRRILYNAVVKNLCRLYCYNLYNRHVFDKKQDLDYNPSCINGTCCVNSGAGYINTDTMIRSVPTPKHVCRLPRNNLCSTQR